MTGFLDTFPLRGEDHRFAWLAATTSNSLRPVAGMTSVRRQLVVGLAIPKSDGSTGSMLGKTLGPYRIEAKLGSGGMGKVYLAEAVDRCAVPPGTRVAVKVVHPHLLSDRVFFKRFLREAEIGRRVTHPNVIRCHDCDQLVVDDTMHTFLVMEYVEGHTLRSLLADLTVIPEELCRHIGREVVSGLSAIHEAGAVHRDLKPENVLITPDHEVKIMDLGVAQLAGEAMRLSRTGVFLGSPLYASPEHLLGEEETIDGRADLYSLGVILYELACGSHPHPGTDFVSLQASVLRGPSRRLGERNPQLSAFFEEVVHALLTRSREERFPSGKALLTVLAEGEASNWWRQREKALRAETMRPLRRIHIPRETGVYGRREELDTLRDLFEESKQGHGRVVLIGGEAGIGKTRLVDELAARLQQDGEDFNFLFGSYPPGGAATMSGAWSTAFREQFGREGLEDTLRGYLSVSPILSPAFAALLCGEPPPQGEAPLTRESIQTVFVHLARGLAEERPTIVLIEDLHFSPEEGRGVFASLALAVPEHRILLVGTARPSLPDRWWVDLERLGHASRMGLHRLGPKDLANLLEDAFQSEKLATELGHRIAQKSDGNPFFVFEIIRGLREGKFISRRPDGTWVTTGVIREIEIPSSVQDLVRARIADLDEREQELLDVAACCGFEFDPLLASDVLGIGHIPALRILAQLERSNRLVCSVGRDFTFDHHQVQEALYSALPPRLREQYHTAIGEVLRTRHPEPRGEDAVDLCEHFLKGHRGENALGSFDAALDHLDKSFLNDQAVALADRALGLEGLLTGVRRAEVLLRKAVRLGILGRREPQVAAIEEALTLVEEDGGDGLCSKARLALGWCHLLKGRFESARGHFVSARDLARGINDRQGEAQAIGGLGSLYSHSGRYEEARDALEGRLAIAREIGDRRGEAMAMAALGVVFYSLGRNREAREQYELSLVIAREIGDRVGEAYVTGNLGSLFLVAGHNEEAREHYERQLAMAREVGDRRSEAIATSNLGFASFALGRYGEARERIQQGLAVAHEIDALMGVGIALMNNGRLLTWLGAPEEAREQLDEGLAIFRKIGARREEGHTLLALAELAEAVGDAGEGLRVCEEGLALARETDDRPVLAGLLTTSGRVLILTDRLHEAGVHLAEALELGRDLNSPETMVLASALLAQLKGSKPDVALAAVAEHEDRLGYEARMEARFLLHRVTRDDTHLAMARDLLGELEDHAPEEYRETMIENVLLHRDIKAAWEEHGGAAGHGPPQ